MQESIKDQCPISNEERRKKQESIFNIQYAICKNQEPRTKKQETICKKVSRINVQYPMNKETRRKKKEEKNKNQYAIFNMQETRINMQYAIKYQFRVFKNLEFIFFG